MAAGMRVEVRIPKQEVEGYLLLSEQIVVHDEGPDEVVAAQHIEGCRHVAGFQIAAFLHALFERGNLIFVDEHRHVADVGEIDEGHEIGRACDTVVAVRRQIAERRSEQRAPRQ